jgi:phytoene synthase
MKKLYDQVSVQCSKDITRKYSTSFSIGIRLLKPELRDPIYAIYGYVRVADEIVDSFEGYDQRALLEQFRKDTFQALEMGISINPVIHTFVDVVKKYHIEMDLIDAFLESMRMDLEEQRYDSDLYQQYIYGSAEVVGLMCLKVFCQNQSSLYEYLKPYAQKINFLRDIKDDYEGLGRMYFPNTNFNEFNTDEKSRIEKDISQDFDAGLEGIKQLPLQARLGVYVAYIYYKMLFKKIKALPGEKILQTRIRVPDYQKVALLIFSYITHRFNLLIG